MKEKIIFLVNPNSGTKKKKKIPKLINALIDQSIFDFEVRHTLFKGEATQIVTEKLAEGYRYFVAVGGDGTINETAKALINTDAILAIIPVGSGNGLARHLNIPLKSSKAIKLINKLKVSTIDYGTINNTPFFCTCGVGFDALIGARFDQSKKRGLISYVRIAISEFFRFKPEKFTLSNDEGEAIQYPAFLITVANASQYGNNAFIAPMAKVRDGLLDTCILAPFNLFWVPQIAWQLFSGKLYQNRYATYLQGSSIKITRASEGLVHLDGETYTMGKELQISIRPKGLNVLVS
jgi:YegS/Rv2252/BmrU family lipid kinase